LSICYLTSACLPAGLRISPAAPTPTHVTCALPLPCMPTHTHTHRYPWPLLQPLITQVMQEQLTKYEAEEHVEVRAFGLGARPCLLLLTCVGTEGLRWLGSFAFRTVQHSTRQGCQAPCCVLQLCQPVCLWVCLLSHALHCTLSPGRPRKAPPARQRCEQRARALPCAYHLVPHPFSHTLPHHPFLTHHSHMPCNITKHPGRPRKAPPRRLWGRQRARALPAIHAAAGSL
jgi:hypothetical protein